MEFRTQLDSLRLQHASIAVLSRLFQFAKPHRRLPRGAKRARRGYEPRGGAKEADLRGRVHEFYRVLLLAAEDTRAFATKVDAGCSDPRCRA
jgi:hypothetical protein